MEGSLEEELQGQFLLFIPFCVAEFIRVGLKMTELKRELLK